MIQRSTLEIPRERWADYLSRVETLQRGRQVDVELIGREIGYQPLTRHALLRAIRANRSGTAAGTIELDLGVEGELDHRVVHPSHIYAIQTPSGQLECLDIEDKQETKTLIRFRRPRSLPARPEPEPGREVLVRHYMTSPPHLLTTGSSLAQASDLMRRHRIRHLPVVGLDGRLRGVLSDRDLSLAKRERGVPPEDVTADEVMTRSPYAVSPDTRLGEAAAVMAERKYGCAVVVEQDRVVGILTTTDALRALVDLRAKDRSV